MIYTHELTINARLPRCLNNLTISSELIVQLCALNAALLRNCSDRIVILRSILRVRIRASLHQRIALQKEARAISRMSKMPRITFIYSYIFTRVNILCQTIREYRFLVTSARRKFILHREYFCIGIYFSPFFYFILNSSFLLFKYIFA